MRWIFVELCLFFRHKLWTDVRVHELLILFRCRNLLAKLYLLLRFDRSLDIFLSVSDQIELLKGLLFENSQVDWQNTLLLFTHVTSELVVRVNWHIGIHVHDSIIDELLDWFLLKRIATLMLLLLWVDSVAYKLILDMKLSFVQSTSPLGYFITASLD